MTMSGTGRAVLFGLAVLWAAPVVASDEAALIAKTRTLKALAGEQGRAAGPTRVVVRLATPGGARSAAAFGLASPTTRARAEALIQAAAEPVLAGLNAAPSANVVRFSTAAGFAATLTRAQILALANDPRVEAIDRDITLTRTLDQSVALIESPQADRAGATGLNTSVVIIDDGLDRTHGFLAGGRIAAEACFLDTPHCPNNTNTQTTGAAATARPNMTHGTHVAGIAAGFRTSGSPRRGVARSARVIPINVFGPNQGVSFSTLQRALEHVDRLVVTQQNTLKIAAINMSIGGASSAEACDADAGMSIMRPVIQRLRQKGVITVVSAGNGGNRGAMGFPACLAEVVSVAATGKTGVVSSYTDLSRTTDLFAPGGEMGACIVSSIAGNRYGAMCGTSMAAPHVAGAIAALKSRVPQASAPQIVHALRSTGVMTRDTRPNGVFQKPQIRMNAALRQLMGPPVAPANDLLARATPVTLTGALTHLEGSTVNAGREANEPAHGGASGANHTVWWRVTAPATGGLRLSTLGSDFDTTLAVYGGSSMAALGPALASNDNASPSVRYSNLTVSVVAGGTYYIAVGGAMAGEQGQVHLSLATTTELMNDAFAQATPVALTGGRQAAVTGSNVGATLETGEPVHLSRLHRTSVWYSVVAPANGRMTVETVGSTFDTVLGVYQGASVGALTALGLNDDAVGLQSRVSFTAVAGQTYHIAVTGFNGATGAVRLTVLPPGPVVAGR